MYIIKHNKMKFMYNFLFFKISMNGLEILCLMVDRMGEDFKIHVSSGLFLQYHNAHIYIR